MRFTWSCAALTLALLSGCVSQPAYTPKTDEQIAQEALNTTVADMKQRGASQAEIDSFIAYSKMTYEDQLRSKVSPTSTPSENMLKLIDSGLFHCELQRNSLKRFLTQEHADKTHRRLVECISKSSSVITSYYYRTYTPSSSSESVKAAVDETYLKWGSYTQSIFKSAPQYLQEQASMSLTDQLSRSQQVILRESLAQQKKKK